MLSVINKNYSQLRPPPVNQVFTGGGLSNINIRLPQIAELVRAICDGHSHDYGCPNQQRLRENTTFTYSRQGSILLEEGPNEVLEFAYNSKNQQVQVKCGNGR